MVKMLGILQELKVYTLIRCSYVVPVNSDSDYTVVMCSDDEKYGGWDRVAHQTYPVKEFDKQKYVELYLPARTAVVLKRTK